MSHHAFALVSIPALLLYISLHLFAGSLYIFLLMAAVFNCAVHLFSDQLTVTGEASHGVTRWLGAYQAESCKASVQISFTAVSRIQPLTLETHSTLIEHLRRHRAHYLSTDRRALAVQILTGMCLTIIKPVIQLRYLGLFVHSV